MDFGTKLILIVNIMLAIEMLMIMKMPSKGVTSHILDIIVYFIGGYNCYWVYRIIFEHFGWFCK